MNRLLLLALALVAAAAVGMAQDAATSKRSFANLHTLNEFLHDQQWLREQRRLHDSSGGSVPFLDQPDWFVQKLDHFNPQDTRTFKQRYFTNDQFYKPGGPIFLYIGGEAALSPRSVMSGFHATLAQEHNAMLVALEHRYYGMSHPFSSLTTENLKWLSSQQALADLAYFITTLRKERGWTSAQQTVTFGGSYPGSLSAWFRLKYPHLTAGSLASSAPVLAKADYFEYDQAVAASAGAQCADAIRLATRNVEEELDRHNQGFFNGRSVKERFQCQTIKDDVDFLYILADAVAFAMQYTSEHEGPTYHLRETLCDLLLDSSAQDPVEQLARFVNLLFGKLGVDCTSFTTTTDALLNLSTDPSLNQRQWFYQSCTEFGFFQTAPKEKPVRSSRITVEYHYNLCRTAFGSSPALEPDVDGINSIYGGSDQPQTTNVAYTNGNIDPWHVLSVLKPIDGVSSAVPILINGTSHCADLATPNSRIDPPSLTAARTMVAHLIRGWLGKTTPNALGTMATSQSPHSASAGVLVTGVALVASMVALTALVAMRLWKNRQAASADHLLPLNSQ